MFGIDLGNIVSNIAKPFVTAAIMEAFPPAALFPGLTNMVADTICDQLGKAVDQCLQQAGTPAFQIKDILNLLKGVTEGVKQPCDRDVADHCRDNYGDSIQSLIDVLIKDFKNAFQQYMNEHGKNGKGGCGKGGSAGGTSGGGNIGFRELAAILAELEQKEAKNVRDKVQAASDALGVAKSAGKDQADANKNAEIEQNQFKATEESKAEAQIFQAVASAVSEVMKNFGGALQTSARGG